MAAALDDDRADGDAAVGWCLAWDGADGDRTLWLLPCAHPALAVVDAAADHAWRDRDLRRGLPRLLEAARERWTPHMLGLERLQAFSVRKGCYPGQEIVARTHFLGQAKRTLRGLAGAFLPESAQVADASGRTVGEVVAVDSTGAFCLAVLPSEAPAEGLLVDARPARVVPLPGETRPSV